MSKKNRKQRYEKYHAYILSEEKKEEEKKQKRTAKREEAAKHRDVEMDDEEAAKNRMPAIKKAIRKKFKSFLMDTRKAIRRSMKGGEEINVGMSDQA